MKFNAVVFDMDGLLVNTEPLWKAAEAALIERRGGVFDNKIRKQIIGLRGQDIAAHFKQVYNFTDNVDVLHEELDARMVALVNSQLEPKQGAKRLLSALHRRGVPCAVASSSTNTLIDAVLENQGWETYFQYRCSAEEEVRGKPAPDVYLRACGLLGQSPENCLALEDSLNGAKAAVSAGMACFVVPSSGEFPDSVFIGLGLPQFEDLDRVRAELGI